MLTAVVLATWWAQAEPAPVAAPPPPPPPPALDNRIAVLASYSRRLGDEGAAIGPRNGFAVGGSYERRVVPLPDDVDLSAGLDFFYDKFQTGVTGTATIAPGQSQTYSADRVISQTSFAAIIGAAWRWRRLRPYAQVGGGITIAYFTTPEEAYQPGNLTAVQPLVRATGGFDVAITRDIAFTARASYTHPFTRPTFTAMPASGVPATYSFLGDLFQAGAGVALGF
jgi:hypothetical protein